MSEGQVSQNAAQLPTTPTPPHTVVVSDSHALVGWARRCMLMGHDVDVYTTRPAFQHCWHGIMDVRLGPKGERPSAWGAVGEAVMAGAATLLTDSTRVTETFAGAPRLFGAGPHSFQGEPGLALAVWWDGVIPAPHALVFLEWGAWAGGRGPRVLGAATLAGESPGLCALAEAWLKDHAPSDWRGLALVGFAAEGGGLAVTGAQLGWPTVVSDLWLWRAERQDVNPLAPDHGDARPPFLVGVPISLPPWPHYPHAANRAAERVPVNVAQVASHIAWHDMRRENGTLVGGGSDGLVGVAVGEGYTLTRARRHALMAAGAFEAPQFQWRSDAGAFSEEALFALDVAGLYR